MSMTIRHHIVIMSMRMDHGMCMGISVMRMREGVLMRVGVMSDQRIRDSKRGTGDHHDQSSEVHPG